MTDTTFGLTDLQPLVKISKDILRSTETLNRTQARYLVKMYYAIQDERKTFDAQGGAMDRHETPEPHEALDYFADSMGALEANLKRALDAYSDSQPPSQWAKTIVGIGPVLSAGLLAHIDIEKAPTVGHIWRYAGLDPTSLWLGAEKSRALVSELLPDRQPVTIEAVIAFAARAGRNVENFSRLATDKDKGEITRTSLQAAGAKRPWNADLKVLCWKIGQSFMKVSGNEKDYYGKLYLQRKEYEIARNERGEMAEQAAGYLAAKNYSKETEAYKAYVQGKLPAGQLLQRSRRYATKIFLSHYQQIAWFDRYDTLPPKPYALSILGHVDELQVPNADAMPGFKDAWERRRIYGA